MLKRFFGLPPRPPTCKHPSPTYLAPKPNLSYWGSAQKGPNLSYWGGMPFWPVSSFLPTFLTIFLYFFFGKRVKTLLWVTPEAPNMQTPIPYLFGSQAKSLLLGVSPKRAKSLLLGGGYLTGGVYGSFQRK